MGLREIVLPETKPALEWINGRVIQKMSPRSRHAIAQTEFATALSNWSRRRHRGTVGTEWEVRIAAPGETRGPLVPDVAYFSFERLPAGEVDTIEFPRIAPDAVVEVLSPGDRRVDVEAKIKTYLACGASVVFLVDTKHRTVAARDADGQRSFAGADIVIHRALPEFALPVRLLFDPTAG